MHSPHRFSGKHILVTGAGTGIGRAIALRLGQEGAILSLLARNTERLEETAQLVVDAGGQAAFVVGADIRDRASVDTAIASSARALGPLYGVVANSGIGGANEPGEQDRFDDLVQTNLIGTYSCLRAFQQHMAPGPDTRHMVVVSSILGRFGVAGYTGYCASKTGLLGLVRAMALELAPQGVQCNAICPGWVETKMALDGIQGMADGMGVTRDEAHAIAMQAVPAGRMSKPAEIAGMVAWLLSADAQGVTGQGLDMNGGAWMQ